MKKLFSLLCLLVSLTLCSSEIDLSSLAPSYTAVAGKIDVAVLQQMPQARQFLSMMPEHFNGIRCDDVNKIIFGCNKNLTRAFLICHFRDEAAWQRLWQTLDGSLTPLPAERRILLFELKTPADVSEKLYFAVLAPRVAAFYVEPASRQNFRCDYSGAPQGVRKYFDSTMPVICGGTLKFLPLKAIRSFYIMPARNNEGLASIRGDIICSEPTAASLTIVALQGVIAAGLQNYCEFSPEEVNAFIRRIKMSQSGRKIRIEFSDIPYLFRLLQSKAVKL